MTRDRCSIRACGRHGGCERLVRMRHEAASRLTRGDLRFTGAESLRPRHFQGEVDSPNARSSPEPQGQRGKLTAYNGNSDAFHQKYCFVNMLDFMQILTYAEVRSNIWASKNYIFKCKVPGAF